VDPFEKCQTDPRVTRVRALRLYPYFVPLTSESGPEVHVDGRSVLMFGSNNYLGLTQHPRVKAAAVSAVEKYGTGCTGSRLLNGTLDLHEELEARIARFIGKESALTFTTGFQANLGTIAALVGRDHIAVIDRASHASIIDGCRLSYGAVAKFRHNDMGDLERVLARHAGERGIVIIVDGVFSMHGDLANLPEIVRLKRKYGARLIVDDAHGVGVLGPGGRGTAAHFGVEDDVDVIVGTFSKSFASTGGFLTADARIIDYVKHAARPFLFSASIPPAQAAAALAALDVMESEQVPLARLWANRAHWTTGLGELHLDTGASETPIVPIVIGDDLVMAAFWRKLFDAGLFVNAAAAPAVEPGHALLRTSCIATHTEDHLERALEIVREVWQQLELVR
jgi:8-amino-7-oxononanoate synthase